ncbi:Hypothetical_protein [Hexamita inflata]|uniref:Hypothetical_protein n=1 Tax=Hexamita inflata TaxID=28002 RepID=A0AA86RIV7_9EUKA|nr:Hypothetical protein HINF_LOCUS63253 [Hexamita inflata]
MSLPSFSLFGFSQNVEIVSSNISVSVPHYIANIALLCFNCSVSASISNFSCVVSGQNVSALSTGVRLSIVSCLVQFRVSGRISGLVSSSRQTTILLKSSNISAYLISAQFNGVFFGYLYGPSRVEISNSKVCSNEARIIGGGDKFITTTGSLIVSCDICPKYYSYGLCADSLINGELKDNKLVCKNEFVFNNICECKTGELVNGVCVNILGEISKIINHLEVFQSKIEQTEVKVINKVQNENQQVGMSTAQIMQQAAGLYVNLNSQWSAGTLTTDQLQTISQNVAKLRLALDCNKIYGYQYINNNCIYVNCPIQGQQSINGVCQCTDIFATVNPISGKCECPVNSNSIAAVCTCIPDAIMQNNICICKVIGAFIKNGKCSCGTNGFNDSVSCYCLPGQRLIGEHCVYIVKDDTQTLTCNQIVYLDIWDMITVTKPISSLSGGFAIPSTQITNNAFVSVNDNILIGVISIYQLQNLFLNVKIQLGSQSFGSVSMLQPATATEISINQMSIVSKAGTSLVVSQNLYILQNQSLTTTSIVKLSVNLNFIVSSLGNITLINIITGTLNVNGYQIYGKYYSVSAIAMIAFYLNIPSTSYIYNIAFQPSAYAFGDLSSYLISHQYRTLAIINFQNVSVILGSKTQFIMALQIYSSQYICFGGLVRYTEGNIFMSTVLFDCYQIFNNKLQYSGLIIGKQSRSSNNIQIQNLCLQQNFQGNSSNNITLSEFGVIGTMECLVQLQQCVIIMEFNQILNGSRFGVLGYGSNKELNILNIQVTIKFYNIDDSGGGLGVIAGQTHCTVQFQNIYIINCYLDDNFSYLINRYDPNLNDTTTIINITVQDSKSQQKSNPYGLLGRSEYNMTFQNTSIISSNISQGFLEQFSGPYLNIINSSLISVASQSYQCGFLFSFTGEIISIQNSTISSSKLDVGFVGYIGIGTVSIQNSTIYSSIINYGFVKSITNGTVQINNSIISSSTIRYGFVGTITNGTASIENSTITNLTVKQYDVSGFINRANNSQVSILNSSISGYQIELNNYGSGFINLAENSKIKIYKSTITGINITKGKFSIVVYNNTNSTFDMQQSYSFGTNLFNGTIIDNCANFVNPNSITGC